MNRDVKYSCMCPPTKAIKVTSTNDEFSHWQETTRILTLNEVQCYAKTSFEENFTQSFIGEKGFNIVKFWQSAQIASQFPQLNKVALGILRIPVSSERIFLALLAVQSQKRELNCQH